MCKTNQKKGVMKVNSLTSTQGRATRPLARTYDRLHATESKHCRWDPKDGELFPSRAKPEETLVEVRSVTDVQIVRWTWV